MPTVLSVDLALTGGDLGIAVASSAPDGVRVELLAPPVAGVLEVTALGRWLAGTAQERGVTLIAIDGPSGWRDPATGEIHARRSERVAHTPSKTGLPGTVKPSPYLRFTTFSIALFDALDGLGWPRVGRETAPATDTRVPLAARAAVESFPYATWRALGLVPLPSKRRASSDDLRTAHTALAARTGWQLPALAECTHDALQAMVALPAALALAVGGGARLVGEPPRRLEGTWREGYILLPEPHLAPRSSSPPSRP